MLRVDPVADHGEGLWSAARDDHGAWLRPKTGPGQKVAGIPKYVDDHGTNDKQRVFPGPNPTPNLHAHPQTGAPGDATAG